ncbi:DUF6338 family protein [Parageobacillus thermoglucosidasius]|nr:DUF6338 family protein [Parageobacillus thermoglucosidasius]
MSNIGFTELTVRLLFLFLPGIVSTIIIDTLTSHRRNQLFHFVIHSFLLGVASYFVVFLLVSLINYSAQLLGRYSTLKSTFMDSLLNNDVQINVIEVFLSTVVGALLAILFVAIINQKILYKISNWLHISNKHGDEDIWEFLFNSNDVEWVNIRDLESKIVYQGAVSAFSHKDDNRELVLSQVKVFKDDESGELRELYDMSFVYFNFDVNSKIIIEIDKRGEENDE